MEGSRFGTYFNDPAIFVPTPCMNANLRNRRLPGTTQTRGLSLGYA
jgi:hypothetical protein